MWKNDLIFRMSKISNEILVHKGIDFLPQGFYMEII